MDVMSALSAARLVPVVVLDDATDADGLAGALVAGGLPVAEVTFRTAAAQDSIRAMAARGDKSWPTRLWSGLPGVRPRSLSTWH